jgi:hypothetical protein
MDGSSSMLNDLNTPSTPLKSERFSASSSNNTSPTLFNSSLSSSRLLDHPSAPTTAIIFPQNETLDI